MSETPQHFVLNFRAKFQISKMGVGVEGVILNTIL